MMKRMTSAKMPAINSGAFWRRTLWCGALFLASAWFVFRVFIHPQAGGRLWDFGIVLMSSQAWLDGRNPYDDAALHSAWTASGGVPGMPRSMDGLIGLMPPPCFPVLAPLAALPTPVAAWGWCLLIIALAAAHTIALGRLLGMRLREWRTGGVLAVWTLTNASLIIGLAAGQPAMLVASLVILGLVLEQRGRIAWSGVLLGIAMAVKLQVAAPFALYWMIRGRVRLVVIASVLTAVLTGVAVGRMELAGVDWWTAWRANMEQAAARGGAGDFTTRFRRDDLVNLQLLLWGFWRNWQGVQWAALGAASLWTATATTLLWMRRRSPVVDVVGWSVFAVLMLLPVYHRTYDAVVLVVPAAWSIANLRGPNRRFAVFNLIVLLPFVLPAFLPTLLLTRGHIPASWEGTWWWEVLVIPSRVWSLLLLFGSLLATLVRQQPAPADPRSPPSPSDEVAPGRGLG